ncbi:MAG: hypothetical protein J3Q66DRAFT_331672 [Benniella sp.]|nr:MAG: hypothetical protein J3Q66DRAFT_331672 [Benniella sp.]
MLSCCFPSINLILEAQEQAKHRFYNNTKQAKDVRVQDPEVAQKECDQALSDALSTLCSMQKTGKRALKKKKNLDLKNGIENAHKQLTQLQTYSGPDKIQKCFEFAVEWSGIPAPAENTQPSVDGQPSEENSEAPINEQVLERSATMPSTPLPKIDEEGRSVDEAMDIDAPSGSEPDISPEVMDDTHSLNAGLTEKKREPDVELVILTEYHPEVDEVTKPSESKKEQSVTVDLPAADAEPAQDESVQEKRAARRRMTRESTRERFGLRSRDPSFHRRVTKDVSSPNLWQTAKMIFSFTGTSSNE